MPFDVPFTLGPFIVDEVGALSIRLPGSDPTFTVAWRNRTISARLTVDHEGEHGSGVLRLRAVLGRVPSTVGDALEERLDLRAQAFVTIRRLRADAPDRWRVGLEPDHRITVDVDVPIALPTSAVILITEITKFLLSLAPYLDETDRAAVECAPVLGGIANTWPG